MQLVLILILALPATSIAQIYKCTQPNGKVAFQQSPCADGSSEKVKLKQTNFLESNDQITYKKDAFVDQANSPRASYSNVQKSNLQRNKVSCAQAQQAYNVEAQLIKAKCKKDRDTYCNKSAEKIERIRDSRFLSRASYVQTINYQRNYIDSKIVTLKRNMDQACR
jgi:hypothetical protein